MHGNIAYYVGVDRTNNAMHNVSVWESVSDAKSNGSLLPNDRAWNRVCRVGVRFDRPILNCDTLWQFDGK